MKVVRVLFEGNVWHAKMSYAMYKEYKYIHHAYVHILNPETGQKIIAFIHEIKLY